jgi:hypothetical protein
MMSRGDRKEEVKRIEERKKKEEEIRKEMR